MASKVVPLALLAAVSFAVGFAVGYKFKTWRLNRLRRKRENLADKLNDTQKQIDKLIRGGL